jgi:hypothetical protein
LDSLSNFAPCFKNKILTTEPKCVSLDLVAILPVVGIIFPGLKIGFIRLLRGIRVLRILRADRMFTEVGVDRSPRWTLTVDCRMLSPKVDATTSLRRQYIMMAFTLLAFMFIAAGAIHLIDDVTDGTAFKKPSNYRGRGDVVMQLTLFSSFFFKICFRVFL